MVTNDQLKEVYENAKLQSTSGLWYPFSYDDSYQNSIDAFLECLFTFLNEGKLRLAKKGKFLEGTIEEQIELFRKSFPDEERMKEVESYWWYLDDCPAGVVWIVDEAVEGFTTPAENGKHYFWA